MKKEINQNLLEKTIDSLCTAQLFVKNLKDDKKILKYYTKEQIEHLLNKLSKNMKELENI